MLEAKQIPCNENLTISTEINAVNSEKMYCGVFEYQFHDIQYGYVLTYVLCIYIKYQWIM